MRNEVHSFCARRHMRKVALGQAADFVGGTGEPEVTVRADLKLLERLGGPGERINDGASDIPADLRGSAGFSMVGTVNGDD